MWTGLNTEYEMTVIGRKKRTTALFFFPTAEYQECEFQTVTTYVNNRYILLKKKIAMLALMLLFHDKILL